MSVIAVTGLGLAFAMFGRGRPINAAVLLYIVVITVTPTWLAWRAVRDQNHYARFIGPVYKFLTGLNLAAGGAILATGIAIGEGFVAAISVVQHYGSIIGSGIATHVTFHNLGLSRLLPPELGETAQHPSWFLPFVVALVARVYLDRKYGPKRLKYARARLQKPIPQLP
jgi:hypothetical protein